LTAADVVNGVTIVIAADFVGRGRYRSVAVRRLAERLRARRHTLVVPEVAVWEWAEQLHQRVRGAALTLGRLRAEVAASGVVLDVAEPEAGDADADEVVDSDITAGVDDVDEFVDRLDADLRTMPGVGIVTATLADGVEAIRNQVLQTGVGSRRNGVKTGAAEGLLVAAVERCTQDRATGEPIVLCTRDASLARYVAELDPAPVVVPTERDLWSWLAVTGPADPSVGVAIRTSVEFELADWLAQGRRSTDIEFPLLATGVVVDDAVVGSAGVRADGGCGFTFAVHDVESLDVHAVEIVVDGIVPRIAVADVTALVVADVIDQACDEHGHFPRLVDAATLTIDVPVTAEFDRSWTFEDFDCADVATVTIQPGA
jgi:hypothetical protein